MADLLQMEIVLWFAMTLATLLAVLTLRAVALHASAPARQLDQLAQHDTNSHGTETTERTMVRWSRVVQESNTAFWMYVSQNNNEHRH